MGAEGEGLGGQLLERGQQENKPGFSSWEGGSGAREQVPSAGKWGCTGRGRRAAADMVGEDSGEASAGRSMHDKKAAAAAGKAGQEGSGRGGRGRSR